MIENTGLQITVGHRTMADQNLPMSDEIPTVVGQNVRTIISMTIIFILDIRNPSGRTWVRFFSAGKNTNYFIEMTVYKCVTLECISVILYTNEQREMRRRLPSNINALKHVLF